MTEHVGFTGTQHGMTVAQSRSVLELLRLLRPAVFHHGDCVGADAQAHEHVRTLRPYCTVHLHPPDDSRKRAFCVADVAWEPKPYLHRNHDIVLASNYLVAAPRGFEEELRSGTWATVRFARSQGTRVVIVWPDGTLGS